MSNSLGSKGESNVRCDVSEAPIVQLVHVSSDSLCTGGETMPSSDREVGTDALKMEGLKE